MKGWRNLGNKQVIKKIKEGKKDTWLGG